jgi:hypothetical protein
MLIREEKGRSGRKITYDVKEERKGATKEGILKNRRPDESAEGRKEN